MIQSKTRTGSAQREKVDRTGEKAKTAQAHLEVEGGKKISTQSYVQSDLWAPRPLQKTREKGAGRVMRGRGIQTEKQPKLIGKALMPKKGKTGWGAP